MVEAVMENLPELREQETQAILDFITRLSAAYPDQVEEVLLYGSKARGDSLPDSDIDLLVLMNSDDSDDRREILRLAARSSLIYDVILSLMVMSKKRWLEHKGLFLYHHVLEDSRKLVFSDS